MSNEQYLFIKYINNDNYNPVTRCYVLNEKKINKFKKDPINELEIHSVVTDEVITIKLQSMTEITPEIYNFLLSEELLDDNWNIKWLLCHK